MTELSVRHAPIPKESSLTQGIRGIAPWSAKGSLRRWLAPLQTSWAPRSALAHGVHEAGFLYDPSQDIIYSRKDAWQHEFGYCYAFDKFALMTSFVFDCEPIFFRHGNKAWMIELWKGQYGLETGAEIGVYNRRDDDNGLDMQALDATVGRREDGAGGFDASHSKFYKCVNRDEYLRIAFRLLRNGTELFARGPELHWWLTGFRWGILSRPESLTMEVSIGFFDPTLQQAFVDGLQHTGYTNAHIAGSTVSFIFDTPHTYQPRKGWGAMQEAVLTADGALVDAYRALGFASNDPNLMEGAIGAKVAGLGAAFLQNGRDVYLSQLGSILERAAADVAQRVKDFFGI